MTELIAFFSRGEENYVNGEIRTLEKGNTEAAAGMIQKFTGADLFKIEPQQAIPQITMSALRRRRQIRGGMPGRSWLRIRRAWNRMMSFILVIPITGGRCRWQYLRFWNILILQERRSDHFVPMREAGWEQRCGYKEAVPRSYYREGAGDSRRKSKPVRKRD